MIRDNDYAKYLPVLIAWVMGAVFVISTGQQYSDSAPRQQTATGTIVSPEPANIIDKDTDFDVADDPTLDRKEPKIGDLVTVYYDSANPA